MVILIQFLMELEFYNPLQANINMKDSFFKVKIMANVESKKMINCINLRELSMIKNNQFGESWQSINQQMVLWITLLCLITILQSKPELFIVMEDNMKDRSILKHFFPMEKGIQDIPIIPSMMEIGLKDNLMVRVFSLGLMVHSIKEII